MRRREEDSFIQQQQTTNKYTMKTKPNCVIYEAKIKVAESALPPSHPLAEVAFLTGLLFMSRDTERFSHIKGL